MALNKDAFSYINLVDNNIMYSLLQVDDVFKVCKEFFAYPLEEKLKYLIRETSNTSGYSYLEREK